MKVCSAVVAVAALSFVGTATKTFALDIFTEDFTDSSAGWANYNSNGFLTHVASGGPDGGAYASGPRSFEGQAVGNTPVALRARHDDPWNSSGDAFARDWSADGIVQIRAWVMHDVPNTDLQFFTRVAGPANFPGHVYGSDVLVSPNTWTQLVFDVSPSSPQLLSEEGSDWTTVFSNVGHVQFGAIVPDGFDTDATFYNLGIDKVTIAIPEPMSVALAAGLVGMAICARRRIRRELADE